MQWFMYKTCYRIDWGAAYQVAVHACLANQPRGEGGGYQLNTLIFIAN